MIKIIEKKVADLIPYENNARINDGAVDAVANSIKEFGIKNPIIIDRDNVIVCGHTRIKACEKLGIEKVPCVVADDLTDEQIKAFRIADNSTAQIAEWDLEKLQAELENIDMDMVQFGLQEQIEEIEKEFEKEVQEDEVPEVDEENEPICKLGDIWQLGRHRLICGDSTDKATVERLMNGENADTILIDPPYDKEDLYNVILDKQTEKKLIVSYDHKHFVKQIMEATKKGWIGRYEFIWDCQQSWYTPNRPLARHKTFTVFMDKPDWNFEKAIVYDGKERKSQQGYNTRGYYDYKPLDGAVHLRTVEQFSNTAMHEDCNQGKPVRWVGAILAGVNAEIVLDLFGGSGSTLIACEQLNRVCYMCELDPKYCDVILKRYENLTGEKAEKIC